MSFNQFSTFSRDGPHNNTIKSPGNTLDTTKLDTEPNAENAPLIQNLVTPHLSVAISSLIQCSKLEEVFGKKKHS
jgi:hypothetical protein